MDRMRESLFAILGDLTGLSFLDLFSGSGVIGIEAASRGADPVVLVEQDSHKRHVILRNIQMVETTIRAVTMSAERFIAASRSSFDLIFLDPPFRYEHKEHLLERVAAGKLLAPGGRVLIHYPREDALPETIGRLVRRDERSYGRSTVSFYVRSGG